jgi:hypothetical protein
MGCNDFIAAHLFSEVQRNLLNFYLDVQSIDQNKKLFMRQAVKILRLK